jgi:uncharacterized membrane protein YczE
MSRLGLAVGTRNRDLTRAAWLLFFTQINIPLMSSAVQITFKDEGDLGGEPIGPVMVTFSDRSKLSCGWATSSEAQYLADQFGLPLEHA